VLVVGDIWDTELSEEEPTEGLGEDVELAADNAELSTGYGDDGVKGSSDDRDDGDPCDELETTSDQGVDVISDEGAEGATVGAIAKNWGEASQLSSTLGVMN
jgi:hypothetical protein